MRIFMTGASGFVGEALSSFLKEKGHEVISLVRSKKKIDASHRYWDPEGGEIERETGEGAEAVIHLAGENIAKKRWNASRKRRIYDSRILGTRSLVNAFRGQKNRPLIFLCASAVGYYGSRGDTVLDEESLPGEGFLAEVCRDWEVEARQAEELGIRVANLRFGMVLNREGGALATMLPAYRWGLGGVIGAGTQYISWIARTDLLRAILFSLQNESIEGAVNCVSPQPVTQAIFAETLGKILHRPTRMWMPEFLTRIAFGEMADEMLLGSCRALPKKLQEAGFSFLYPELHEALQKELR